MELFVADRVQEYAWKQDLNCAQTTLLVLSEKFKIELNSQIIDGSSGLNGAGQYQAQCGLVEGALIFMGIYLRSQQKEKLEIQNICKSYAQNFESKFGSLSCSRLRPNGFNLTDPPHLCSDLTEQTLLFAIDFISTY
ncbi:MAG: redox-active protein [Bacteroidetes bacterium HGW-Bacteroidetes-20]|nr:MAG: redox-active protein [Bacteroidetes bacterium HGW-Bacteroidetes-20]PKP34818.1 MAG: redox-active protein [Bacteroidetes bacterium HGW-Bacteroidetes-17]